MGDQSATFLEDGTLVQPPPPVLPVNDPRDTWLLENLSEADANAVKFLKEKAEEMRRSRWTFVDGEVMKPILKVLGARDADIEEMRKFNDNLNDDPHLEFRKTAMYRLGIDQDKGVAHRLNREPFVLSAKEGFKRKDTGLLRFFGEPQMWHLENTAWQALMRFKFFMMEACPTSARDGCDEDPKALWNQCGFFLRTITTNQRLGEPAMEGIHQDGVQYTMTTMFGSENMRNDSAKSTLWTLDQKIGVPEEQGNPDNIIATAQHLKFLDTLIFADNEQSHSVGALYMKDPEKIAVRDMGVFFTRKFAKKGGGFSAEPYDTEEQHERLPFAMSLRSPHLAATTTTVHR